MIREWVLATRNKGKVREMEQMLPGVRLLSLADIGFEAEIDEPYLTFRENALAKAAAVHAFCGRPVLADDSGICADALGGAPGVHSARYAGDGASDQENLEKLLREMAPHADRSAHYEVALCLLAGEGKPYFFEATCEGKLLEAPAGEGGFGYDPVFVPDGYSETFGQLPADIKHRISHRGKAVQQLQAFAAQLQATEGTAI